MLSVGREFYSSLCIVSLYRLERTEKHILIFSQISMCVFFSCLYCFKISLFKLSHLIWLTTLLKISTLSLSSCEKQWGETRHGEQNLVHRSSWRGTAVADCVSSSPCPRGSFSWCEVSCDLQRTSFHVWSLPAMTIHKNKLQMQMSKIVAALWRGRVFQAGKKYRKGFWVFLCNLWRNF